MAKLLIGFGIAWLLFGSPLIDRSRTFSWMNEPLARWNDELSKAEEYVTNCANQEGCDHARKYQAMMQSHGERRNRMLGEMLAFNACVLREPPMMCKVR